MVRIAVRNRSGTTPASLAGAIALGLGLGALATFVAGELAGPAAGRIELHGGVATRRARPGRRTWCTTRSTPRQS